ncbi:MAG: hypothetical protein SGJ24_07865 [Chloroflexota bacterium]|nr:hypothetical protein [Chloroflexota bacterium]
MPQRKTMFIRALLFSFVLTIIATVSIAPAIAQSDDLPTDPLQRAFRLVRDELQDKFGVDLLYVQNWTFDETEFTGGIDSCLENLDPAESRGLYYGWRFVITALSGRQFEGRSSFDSTIITACDTVTVAAAAPAAAPAADGSLPAPVAGAGATGAFELGGHALELNAGTVGVMRRSGMSWVKFQHRYSPGQDPSAVAGIINSARTNGFKILVAVVGSPAELGANFDGYTAAFATFLGGVAALNPEAIEVWNEPNIDREWPAGQINGGTYTRMLAASFNAIKARNPNTIVISGAPAPTGFFGAAGCTAQGCNDDVFMQQMAAAGAGNYMDCIGLHYNEGIVAPSAVGGDSRGSYPSYFFGSMLNRGHSLFGGKPVCWTELGYLSPEGYDAPLPGGFAWAQNTSVAEHAAWLAEAATLSAQSGKVRLMITWNVDFPFYTATDPVGGYAIIRPGGACPACDSLGTVMRR